MRRLLWAAGGYCAGMASSIWVQRRVRRTIRRAAPEQIREQVAARSREVADRARRVVIDLRDAAHEGRAEMRAQEVELRATFGPDHERHRGPSRAVGEARGGPPRSRPRRR